MVAWQASEAVMAHCIMTVVDSASLDELGQACHSAMNRLIGSGTVGLYVFDGLAPVLKYSEQVPKGFLEEYSHGLGRDDPLIDCLLNRPAAIDGVSVYGETNWHKSTMYDLLSRWGYHHNLGGPLKAHGELIGILYTAQNRPGRFFRERARHRMDILCEAVSIALERIDTNDRVLRDEYRCSMTDFLPPRSAEVAQLIVQGASNKQIARVMDISDQTVKEHVANLCRKLNACNRTELAAQLALISQNGARPVGAVHTDRRST